MHHSQLDRIEARIKRMEQRLENLCNLTRATLSEVLCMPLNFDTLVQKVTELQTVNQSAIELLSQLSAEIRATAPTQEAIDALADQIDANKVEMAAAVTANTPAT